MNNIRLGRTALASLARRLQGRVGSASVFALTFVVNASEQLPHPRAWFTIIARCGTIGFLGGLVEAGGACPLRASAGNNYRTLPCGADTTEQVVAHAGGDAATEKAVITVNEDNDNREISLGMGNKLEVRLASQPGTGYGWQVADPLPSVLRLVEKGLDFGGGGQAPSAPGASATAVLRFAPVGAGAGDLRLVYARPWEKEAVPKKTYTLHVHVR
jgi:inhibitor of cysteine peptidase